MTDERRDLTPDEFGAAVSKLVACCWSESALKQWGSAHAAAFDAIAQSHPEYHHAARQAYGRRLAELRAMK